MSGIRATMLAAIAAAALADAAGAQNLADVEIRTHPLADGVFMLEGAGGNIGVSAGVDGVFLIDDQLAPLTPKIRAAVSEISDRPIRFVLNTHWHSDHTGGNENLARAGALIVAHDNVRRRMSTEQFMQELNRTAPPSPAGALPVVTFTDSVTFHLNGDEIVVFHAARAHTDGDAIVHFTRANVVHMGDCFFNGIYPFIDVSAGGSIEGMIEAAGRVLPRLDARTRVIPGHGPVGTREELQAFRTMLVRVHGRVRTLVDQGKSVDEVVAARPTAEMDAAWGKGFLDAEAFVRVVYADLSRRWRGRGRPRAIRRAATPSRAERPGRTRALPPGRASRCESASGRR